jgi:hypothetical protein
MINKNNIEEYILMAIDNELTAEEVLQLNEYIQSYPWAMDLYQSYSNTKLVPDSNIKYPSTLDLYKIAQKPTALAWYKTNWAKAASLVLLVSATYFIVINFNNKPNSTNVVSTTTVPNNIIKDTPVINILPDNNSEIDNQNSNINNVVKSTKDNNSTINKKQINAIEKKSSTQNIVQSNSKDYLPQLLNSDQNNEINLQAIAIEKIIVTKQTSSIANNSTIKYNTASINKVIPAVQKNNNKSALDIEFTDGFLSNNVTYNKIKKVAQTVYAYKDEFNTIRQNGAEFALEFKSPF